MNRRGFLAAIPLLMLTGCHRQITDFGVFDWAVIGGMSLFVVLIFMLDIFLERQGFRIEPAPHIGLNEPTTIQGRIAAEANKQHEHAGEMK